MSSHLLLLGSNDNRQHPTPRCHETSSELHRMTRPTGLCEDASIGVGTKVLKMGTRTERVGWNERNVQWKLLFV